jgi:succinoglycan biosynthesis protein ExoM
MFFVEASLKGARFGYAPDAVVTEETPPARATLKWLLLRRYRAGQIHHLVLGRLGKRASGVAMAIPKCAASLVMALLTSWNQRRAIANLLRAALHAGVIAAAVKAPLYREYAGEKAGGGR